MRAKLPNLEKFHLDEMSSSIETVPDALVHIISEDQPNCDFVTNILTSQGYRIVASRSAKEFTELQPQDRSPGCIILDVVAVSESELTFLRQHREDIAGLPVVVLTSQADVATAVMLMKAGASSLLLKTFELVELLLAVAHAVMWDKQTYPTRMKAAHVKRCLGMLSERQRRIKRMVLSGDANKVIAGRLSVSERTVELERAWILKLFGVKNAIELAVMITEGKVQVDPTFGLRSGSLLANPVHPPHFDQSTKSARIE
jgi:two-component system response regulator FixJ